jgi:predicted small lipoprotein YifL
MRALKLTLALLALLALLAGCGALEPAEATEAEPVGTTATEPTTEAPPAQVAFRMLDLNDPANQRQREAYGRMQEERDGDTFKEWEYRMSGTKVLKTRYPEGAAYMEIVLLDTGRETVLMKGNGLHDSENYEQPWVDKVIDERYFSYCTSCWEWQGESGIYDTQEMKAYPARCGEGEWPRFVGAYGGSLYYVHSSEADYSGPQALWRGDITMKKDGALYPVNLLEGTDIRVEDQHQGCVSPDGKYYIVRGIDEIAVIDIARKKEISRVGEPYMVNGYCWFEDAHTFYGESDENTMLEIKLN